VSRADTWALVEGEFVIASTELVAVLGYPAAAAAYVLHYRGKPEDGGWVTHSVRGWGRIIGVPHTSAHDGLSKLVEERLAERAPPRGARAPVAYRLSYEGLALFAQP
jgi:hypothetical protein